MTGIQQLPLPKIDALLLGAHRPFGPSGLPVLTDEALFRRAGVRIAFTTRAGGVSEGAFSSLNCAGHVGDDPVAVQRNRQIVLGALGAEGSPLIVPSQVHGTGIARCGTWGMIGPDGMSGPLPDESAPVEADGVLVDTQGVAALLNFADCLPLILVAPNGAFAVVHCGWRGTVAGIAGAAARELAQASGCSPAQFNAYIGPHIRSECFEVGGEVAGRFIDRFGPCAVPDDTHVDLARAVCADLLAEGVEVSRICDAGLCTVCHSAEFFSYRATGGTCGRHAAVAYRP